MADAVRQALSPELTQSPGSILNTDLHSFDMIVIVSMMACVNSVM